jgi:hypothetical protein
MQASKDAADSLAMINKTQAAISALEGGNKPVPDYPCLQDSAPSVKRTTNHSITTVAEPGFFYDSSGQLRPNGWIDVVETEAATPVFTLSPIPSDDFADSGDLLGLRG